MNQITTNLGNVVDLTPHIPQPLNKNVPKVKSDPEQPMINLSDYQKELLAEISKNPKLMNLLKIIFNDYPKTVIMEYRQSSPHASPKQHLASRKTRQTRLQMEAFIEQELVKVFGIDLQKITNNNIEKPEISSSDVQDLADAELITPVDIATVATKKSKKKSTKKKSKKK